MEFQNQEPSYPEHRYFKLIDQDGYKCGRYSGSTPKQAANKALTTILFKIRQENVDFVDDVPIKFSIQECTRGSSHKKYEYEGKRVKLETPMEIQIGDKKISYKLKKIKDPKIIQDSDKNTNIQENQIEDKLIIQI